MFYLFAALPEGLAAGAVPADGLNGGHAYVRLRHPAAHNRSRMENLGSRPDLRMFGYACFLKCK